MDNPRIVFQVLPDSARKITSKIFSGSELERVVVKKTGRTLIQMKPNLSLGRSFPRMFRPALTAYLLAGSAVLGLFGVQLEVEISDD